MTVKEVIAKLQECGEDNEVVDDFNRTIVGVTEMSGVVKLQSDDTFERMDPMAANS